MQIGKMMMVLGAALLVAGALFYFGGRFHFLGHLPGDLHISKNGVASKVSMAASAAG